MKIGRTFGVRKQAGSIQGFTLIELILVMTLLIVVISFSAPSLGKFFRGRALDGEARRLLSLSREGQSRAASEGVPVVLWVDPTKHQYGLEQDLTFVDHDDKSLTYTLDKDVTIEMVNGVLSSAVSGDSGARNLPGIRFQPDGSFDEASPEALRLQDREGSVLYLAQSRNRLNYEISNKTAQR
ncbi:MAG: prepilin-type N-terminal cleavage/methylation domain-containing protein [Verrucomicrobia bacterium]|nr:prepilin-type N-terminal cleavage/methylation domain-containing protein [Verrucomicrobiota bacterium]